MSIIIGGSGSTGSSLVKNILNRNKDIFAGEETSFFAKKMIYDDWNKAKSRIGKRKLGGLKNFGYHMYNGTDIIPQEFGYSIDELTEIANESTTLDAYCDSLYAKVLVSNNARIWLEKTPANSACFAMFLNHFSDGKVIHMLRNPYDTVASLWDRGYDLHYAVGIYLLNTASGLSARTYDNYLEVKYEDVIKHSIKTIKDICTFLGVEYSSDMLTNQKEKIEVSQLSGWNYDETANIGTKAVGRFGRMPEEKRNQIIEAIALIEVSDAGKKFYKIAHSSIKELCETLHFDYQEVDNITDYTKIKRMLKRDRLERIKRGYATGIYYPLEVSKKK